jgi:quinol monooxygenase YgiN
MTNEYIRYRIPAEQQTAFLADYAAAAAQLRASPVCLGYELSRCEEEDSCFILRIVWQSTAAHLQQFRASAQFQQFLPLIRPYVPYIEEMRHYAPTALQWRRAPT